MHFLPSLGTLGFLSSGESDSFCFRFLIIMHMIANVDSNTQLEKTMTAVASCDSFEEVSEVCPSNT